MYAYKPLENSDFSGGFCDDYIGADQRRGQFVTNVFALNNKTLRSRWGCQVDSLVDAQIPVGTQRINTLINYNTNDTLFVHSGKRIYYRNPVNWATVSSTVGSDLFVSADAQTHLGHTQWNKHLIITSEDYDKPIKIFKDATSTVRARTAGLPYPTAPTFSIPFSVATTVTGNAVADQFSSGLVTHGLTTGDPIRFSAPFGTLPSPIVINTNYYAIVLTPYTFQVAATRVDALAGNFINLTTNGSGTFGFGRSGVDDNSYVYAIFYSYEYGVFDQTFIDLGPTTLAQRKDVSKPDYYPINVNLPTLVNGIGDHYDTANVKIQIYRTISGGQELYKVGEVTNGTTVFQDSLSDDDLQLNEAIYTSGGAPDNDPPPLAKFCHTVNNVTYYGNLKIDGQIYPATIKQSQYLDPDSVPGSYEDQLEDEITGISSVQDVPIVGCRKHIYRVDGTFDIVGRGGMTHRRISDHAGCLSHESFVQAEGSLFWLGNDGIYVTEGFRCTKVTNHWNGTYRAFKDSLADKTRKIKGVFHERERFIFWTISTVNKVTGQEECDALILLDLNWGISEEMTSMLWKGYSTFDPTSVIIFNDELYRADKRGYILKFSLGYTSDDKIVAGADPTTWFHETIMYQYRTGSFNFGSDFKRKIANKLLLNANTTTNLSMQLVAINDDGRLQRPFTPIRWRKNFIWGDEDFIWGDPNFVWYYGGIVSIDRRFPAKGLRFNFLQIDLSNAYINIINSDLYGLVDVDAGLKTITLQDAVNSNWPTQAVDYYIYLEQDNFTHPYLITDRTDDTLVVYDPTNTLQTSAQRFQIKGYKKDEVLNLVGYSISYAESARSYDTYNQGESGDLE